MHPLCMGLVVSSPWASCIPGLHTVFSTLVTIDYGWDSKGGGLKEMSWEDVCYLTIFKHENHYKPIFKFGDSI